MLSTIGCLRNKDKAHVENFYYSSREMISQINPKMILLRTTQARYKDVKQKIGFEDRVKYNYVRYTT